MRSENSIVFVCLSSKAITRMKQKKEKALLFIAGPGLSKNLRLAIVRNPKPSNQLAYVDELFLAEKYGLFVTDESCFMSG